MAAKIQKGFALTIAVMAFLSLVLGIGVSVLSWVIASKSPTNVNVKTHDSDSVSISFHPYWWGGIGFVIPGILGIIAGWSRNAIVMVFFMIFNIICLLASLAMSVLVALLIALWAIVDTSLNSGSSICVTPPGVFGKECACRLNDGDIYVMNGVTCDDMMNMKTLLSALIALGAIGALISFIASYISCCSLCNKENESPGTVIIQQPPPGMYVAQQGGYPPYGQHNTGYAGPPPYAQNMPVHDEAKLVKNEVI